jgi:hypothetical protein
VTEFEDRGKMRISPALDEAVEQAKRLLFRPFDIAVWVSFGCVVFLEYFSLRQVLGWMSNGFQMVGASWVPPTTGQAPAPAIVTDPQAWLREHRLEIALWAGVLVVIYLVLGTLFLYLQSRAKLMRIRITATLDARLAENWRAVGPLTGSLFLFRLVLYLIWAAAAGTLLGGAALRLLSLAEANTAAFEAYLRALAPWVVAYLGIAFLLWIVTTLLDNFVAPLMYRFNLPVGAAWSHFRAVSRGNIGAILLFLLIRFAYHIPFPVLAFAAGCLTCFMGFLPVIHQTILAPFYAFDRAFSLALLGTLGPDYRMLADEPPAQRRGPGAGYAAPPLLDIAPGTPASPPAPPYPKDGN